jgi:hypothetical protein
MARQNRKLKPTGHSAFVESLIQPAIVLGSTIMSMIAAYVLGLDELNRILEGRGQASDVFIVSLTAGMGFLIDMAIIVSATRYKMHVVRADPREDTWKNLAKLVLLIGLSSEFLTLFYFFIHLGANTIWPPLVSVADFIHGTLSIARAFLPPVVIAYFVAGILPVVVERGDRNREIKVRTSSNILILIDRLSEVKKTDDKQEMLKALGGQMMLDTYATYDKTSLTSEADQLTRDVRLLRHLAKLNGLNWDLIESVLDEAIVGIKPAQPIEQPPPAPQPGGAETGEVPLFAFNGASL